MDSITQAALGAGIAGAIAGRRCNGKVLLAGALLGTLPDLDVLVDYGNDVSNTIKHRGFTHSLLLLVPFSLVLAWIVRKVRPLDDWPFRKLVTLITCVLVTHPLLDYFTTYGTQLAWPLPGYFALSSIFIIDPAYTLPLLLAVILSLRKPSKGRFYCSLALTISCCYLLWSLVAKHTIEQRVAANLRTLELTSNPVFITPMPFNTVLWRVVVIDGERYLEGMASFLDDTQRIDFIEYKRGAWPLTSKPELLRRYQVFTNNFVTFEQLDNKLIVSDLRMGVTGNLAFQFEFATKDGNGDWQEVTPSKYQQMSFNLNGGKLYQRILGDQSIRSITDE